MIEIGKYNTLAVVKVVDFGVYLDGGDGLEILLPARYVEDIPEPGTMLRVFIYKDSEDRLIATTEHPYATVGEFAFLQVKAVNRYGAFIDWGLSKDLLVPFSEQKVKMKEGGVYLVYLYLDHATQRVVASARIERFIGNTIADYKHGDKVSALIFAHTDLGYRCIVDNLHFGMIYDNEVYTPLEIGVAVDAYVKHVREDGKIDLTVGEDVGERMARLAGEIYRKIVENNGRLPVSDNSTPELIRDMFACSKKDFKRAIGKLYKDKKIVIGDDYIAEV